MILKVDDPEAGRCARVVARRALQGHAPRHTKALWHNRVMALTVQDPEATRLAHELAQRQGRSVSEAVVHALREVLDRERRRDGPSRPNAEGLLAIGRHCASLPVLDTRSEDDILGYDEYGLPR